MLLYTKRITKKGIADRKLTTVSISRPLKAHALEDRKRAKRIVHVHFL
jgi:hypothetical protein